METLKSKTFWSAIAALIAAIGGYMSGDVTQAAALPTAVISILGIFIRQAISKLGARVDEATTAVEVVAAKTADVQAKQRARIAPASGEQ